MINARRSMQGVNQSDDEGGDDESFDEEPLEEMKTLEEFMATEEQEEGSDEGEEDTEE